MGNQILTYRKELALSKVGYTKENSDEVQDRGGRFSLENLHAVTSSPAWAAVEISEMTSANRLRSIIEHGAVESARVLGGLVALGPRPADLGPLGSSGAGAMTRMMSVCAS
ncbi:unnamed protein product [Heligmosomoides polygyrus]|uniref:Uncharacterized protein n=1 Tax=Heligmosomoides polygyrus TaxID=6339 RepID=A0A183G3D8_HELPZ|nr:unnamed protein product [Heligmosomoides polygyrus]